MTIHIIGDSHSENGWNSNVINHSFQNMLCYAFGINRIRTVNIKNFNINDGDSIIFCFGELDCRSYIKNNVNELITYQQIINDIIINYFNYISFSINYSGVNFKKICVFNVVPPVEQDNTIEDIYFPFLGTDEERKSYVLYFNTKLKEYCELNNYIFFDVYDKYTDENGFLKKDLSDGRVHIKNGIYIDEFITNNDI